MDGGVSEDGPYGEQMEGEAGGQGRSPVLLWVSLIAYLKI